jgi:hypothetical protein
VASGSSNKWLIIGVIPLNFKFEGLDITYFNLRYVEKERKNNLKK